MRELVAFLGVSALVIVTPGQDTALTIRNTLLGGRAAGVCTAVGVSVGQATWTVCTALGVGALLVASEPAFLALKLAGAAYLIYLGVQALLHRGKTFALDVGRPRHVARRAASGSAEQPRQPEDAGVLHEPAAAVRKLVRRPARRSA